MRYLMLLAFDEEARDALGSEEQAARRAEYTAASDEMRRRGVWRAEARLRPASTATTVRVREGEIVVGDGPFAETKEQIGGFFLVDCPDLDDAVQIAALVPTARHGTVEVRPLWEP